MFLKGTLEGKPDLTEDVSRQKACRKSICIGRNTQNLNLLGNFNLKKVWILSLPSSVLEEVLPLLSPRFLSIYNVQVKDLSFLEKLEKCQTLFLEWNNKADQLWDFKKTQQITSLAIRDFPKIIDLESFADAVHLKNLSIEGGIDKPMKIQSLKPLASLKNLKTLRLANVKVQDNSLGHLKELRKLKNLWVSNQFSTEEFAKLSVEMPKVNCSRFKHSEKVKIYNKHGELELDTMITGINKPCLHSVRDRDKIHLYKSEFTSLQNKYRKELKS